EDHCAWPPLFGKLAADDRPLTAWIRSWTDNPTTTLHTPTMKRIIITLLALSLAAAPAAAQDTSRAATASHAAAEGEVLELSRTKWRWMSERKVDSLAALFHN